MTAELKKLALGTHLQNSFISPSPLSSAVRMHSAKIESTVIVASGGEETLTAVSTLLAQCGKVGGNLNQLARHFNSGGADTEQTPGETP